MFFFFELSVNFINLYHTMVYFASSVFEREVEYPFAFWDAMEYTDCSHDPFESTG